jgi:hypothetical protein
MNRKERILELITSGISSLDEIDKMIETQSAELQTVDLELSDLYHIIENNELDKDQSFNLVKRIHELRVKRRELQEEHEIELTYNTHKSKLSGDNTRQFLLAEIKKTLNRLGSEYKNRILDDKKIEELLEGAKKRGRPRKEIANESKE